MSRAVRAGGSCGVATAAALGCGDGEGWGGRRGAHAVTFGGMVTGSVLCWAQIGTNDCRPPHPFPFLPISLLFFPHRYPSPSPPHSTPLPCSVRTPATIKYFHAGENNYIWPTLMAGRREGGGGGADRGRQGKRKGGSEQEKVGRSVE